MTHVFEGQPDGRQSDDVQMPTSRFRPRYRALSEAEKAAHDDIKAQAEGLEHLFEHVRDLQKSRNMDSSSTVGQREVALALTKLEEAVMWAVKGLTA